MTDLDALKIVLAEWKSGWDCGAPHGQETDVNAIYTQVEGVIKRAEAGNALEKAAQILRDAGNVEFVGENLEGLALAAEDYKPPIDLSQFDVQDQIKAMNAVSGGYDVPNWLDANMRDVRRECLARVLNLLVSVGTKEP